jgi:hypothetical protein
MDDHTKNLDYLVLHPHILGIDNVIWATKEMTFYKGGRIYCQPDLVYYNGDLWLGEYTCSPHHKFKKLEQLERAKEMAFTHLSEINRVRDIPTFVNLVYIVKKGKFAYDMEHIRRQNRQVRHW